MVAVEIERKFLVKRFPDLEELDKALGLKLLSEHVIEQSYVCWDDVEVRLRKKEPVKDGSKKYSLSAKDDGDIKRSEVTIYLVEKDYLALMGVVKGEPITKLYRRYLMGGGKILEISVVDKGKNTEFMYGEIEFENVDEAEGFDLKILGDLVEKDVTFEDEWKMKNYWGRTRG